MFDSPDRLLLGLLIGIVFGFLLQKGRVAKFSVIVGQFILKDWTVAKIMGTAVVVGSVGVYALVASGHAELHVKPFLLGGVLLGGVCFGVGMVVLGYCPGTGVAACGEGKPDAMVGVLGMLAGALAFVAAWPALQPVIKGLGDMGKITLPDATGTSPWIWVIGFFVFGTAALILLGSRSRDDSHQKPCRTTESEPRLNLKKRDISAIPGKEALNAAPDFHGERVRDDFRPARGATDAT